MSVSRGRQISVINTSKIVLRLKAFILKEILKTKVPNINKQRKVHNLIFFVTLIYFINLTNKQIEFVVTG